MPTYLSMCAFNINIGTPNLGYSSYTWQCAFLYVIL